MCNTSGCEHSRLIDPHRSMCLCDVGAPDYIVATVIDANGEQTLWLARRDLIGCDNVDHGDEQPAHEKLGRLPRTVRERIWGNELRCGRRRSNGELCKHRVKEPGQACPTHAHREARR